jgi:hypothetical protein
MALSAKSARGFFSDALIDGKPALHVAAEMCGRRSGDKSNVLADTIAASQTARDDAQRTEARLRELEDGRRCTVDIVVDKAHLRPDIAPRVP